MSILETIYTYRKIRYDRFKDELDTMIKELVKDLSENAIGHGLRIGYQLECTLELSSSTPEIDSLLEAILAGDADEASVVFESIQHRYANKDESEDAS
jgi:hypothetical protein